MYSEIFIYLFIYFQSKGLKCLRDLVWARSSIRSPVGIVWVSQNASPCNGYNRKKYAKVAFCFVRVTDVWWQHSTCARGGVCSYITSCIKHPIAQTPTYPHACAHTQYKLYKWSLKEIHFNTHNGTHVFWSSEDVASHWALRSSGWCLLDSLRSVNSSYWPTIGIDQPLWLSSLSCCLYHFLWDVSTLECSIHMQLH